MDTSNNSPASPGRDGPDELIAPESGPNVQLDVQVGDHYPASSTVFWVGCWLPPFVGFVLFFVLRWMNKNEG